MRGTGDASLAHVAGSKAKKTRNRETDSFESRVTLKFPTWHEPERKNGTKTALPTRKLTI